MSQFAFGYTNTTAEGNQTETYTNLTVEYYNQTIVTLGHPGIALPAASFVKFATALNELSNNAWNCTQRMGYICAAPVTCSAFVGGPGSSYNLTGLDFRIVFETQEDRYLRIPLTALMRNSLTVPSMCEILVYYL